MSQLGDRSVSLPSLAHLLISPGVVGVGIVLQEVLREVKVLGSNRGEQRSDATRIAFVDIASPEALLDDCADDGEIAIFHREQ
jgi:hypothetical protein